MFYSIEFIPSTGSSNKVELIVSTPSDAVTTIYLLLSSDNVKAFKCNGFKPSDLGMTNEWHWDKYRSNGFTQEDYYY